MPGHAGERGPARGVRRDQAGRGGVVDGRELRGGDPGRGQHVGVPAARDLIEQAGARGHREARGQMPGEPRVQVLAEAAPDGGAREDLGAALAQPAELGGEERGVQRRAGARVNAALVVRAAERGGRGRAAGVRPGDDRRERAARAVEREQAVPEHGGAHRRDLGRARAAAREAGVERARHRGEQGIGVQLDAAVRRGARLVGDLAFRAGLRPAGLVEDAGARRAGADVQRQDEHVRYYTMQWISGSDPTTHSPDRQETDMSLITVLSPVAELRHGDHGDSVAAHRSARPHGGLPRQHQAQLRPPGHRHRRGRSRSATASSAW